METVNDRVKNIRKTLDLSQSQFAKLLGVRSAAIVKIENGDTKLTKQNILLICTPNHMRDGKTININWLHTGNGDMFNPSTAHTILDEKGKPLDLEEGMFISIYRQLNLANRDIMKVVIDAMLKSQGKGTEKPS